MNSLTLHGCRPFAQVRRDRAAIVANIGRLPEHVRDHLTSDEFVTSCLEQFNDLDTDGNGVLTPDELFPVIEELMGFSPWALSLDHCKK
jgi:hypothetical protein